MISPTQLNYYHLCHRKLWLFSRHIRMEQTSDLVAEGKLVEQTHYPRRSAKWQQLDLGIAKIDFYDHETRTVHEVKKSAARKEAHVAQLKYYLYLLKEAGIEAPKGMLEYPDSHDLCEVLLDEQDIQTIYRTLDEIRQLLDRNECPERLPKSTCKKCSYFEFCWSGETES